MGMTSRLTVKGQVTVPKNIRQKLKVGPGDLVSFVQEDDKVFIKPVKTLLDYQGAVKNSNKIKDWEDVRKKAREHVSRKVMGGK